MNVLYFLVPIALLLAGAGALAFRWAVNDGQFDDLDSPAYRMLIDEEKQFDQTRSSNNKRETNRDSGNQGLADVADESVKKGSGE